MHFGKLIIAASTTALAVAAPSVEKEKRAKKFKWFGVNESGAEFGSTNIPGQLNKDYTWPPTSTIDTLVGKGLNIFRVPVLMERIIPNHMTGTVNTTYTDPMIKYLNYITSKGAYAILDPHNFGRYYNSIITDYTSFQAFWKTVANLVKSNDHIIFDCNNEPHDMGSASVKNLMQACINGVRAAGATSQYIFVEGTSYSGAWTWVSAGNGADLLSLTDPQNKIIYEMHQYLDSDGSGTSANCVSSTIGSERVKAATAWLKTNKKKGILGEYAGGANSQCQNAVKDLLSYLGSNNDVWQGALWWGGGPWWGNYIYSMEPPSGSAYTSTLPLILPYA